jgi:plexin A
LKLFFQEPRKGPVIVKVSDFRGESKQNFEFVDPQIKAIRPRRGPQSGGTRIKILGDHMDAGSFKEAFIGDYPCEIVETRPGNYLCFNTVFFTDLDQGSEMIILSHF